MNILHKLSRLIMEYVKDDISYHESGHMVIASMFPDVFKIKYVTVNKEISKAHDVNSLGGMRGSRIKPIEQMNIFEHHSMILIMLSGFCADNINNNWGVNKELYYNNVWKDKLSGYKYSGDLELINIHLEFIKGHIKTSVDEYLLNSIKITDALLDTAVVWTAVEKVRNILNSTDKLFVTEDDVNHVFENMRYIKWVDENLYDMLINHQNPSIDLRIE